MKRTLEQVKWHKYFTKWLVISGAIGVVCRLSSIIFIPAIKAVSGIGIITRSDIGRIIESSSKE